MFVYYILTKVAESSTITNNLIRKNGQKIDYVIWFYDKLNLCV